MADLESALDAVGSEIAEAQKKAEALSKLLKRLRQAAANGHMGDLAKGLATVAETGRAAEAAASRLPDAWNFDAKGHLASGYAGELAAEAVRQGLRLVEKDGRLYAFPLVLRIEAGDLGVRLGRKMERRIRPSALVRLLAAVQKRPQRFPEQRFLDLLYRSYERLARGEWRRDATGMGPVVSLLDIHAMLTLLPGSDYPVEEFGRDLLLLDRQPDLRARDGSGYRLVGSALARERVQPVRAYDETGGERAYYAIAFVREA